MCSKKKQDLSLMGRLKSVLIHNVGDTRCCPYCKKPFIPKDPAANDSWNIYKELFGEKKDE